MLTKDQKLEMQSAASLCVAHAWRVPFPSNLRCGHCAPCLLNVALTRIDELEQEILEMLAGEDL